MEGIEYHQGAEEDAQTREEMIRSLRFRDELNKLCETSPPYIRLWTELLGSWPTIINGGCRFLLQCRQWLPVQMRALAKARIQWSDGRVIRFPQESDLQYSRFGLTPEQIGDQSWTEPVTGRLRMMRPPGVKIEVLDFKIATVKSFELGRACAMSGRIQRWSILEWVLLKPEVLKMFLSRMESQEGFRKFYMSLFDMLRLVHRRIFDEKALEIEDLNKTLNTGVLLDLETERKALEAEEARVLARKSWISWLEGLTEDWELRERFRWRDQVSAVPGVKARSGVKRSQSKSKVKPGKLKRMKLKARAARESSVAGVVVDPPCPAPSQPGSGSPRTGYGIGAKDGGRRDAENVGSAARRTCAATRRSRKDGPRVLSYDELIKVVEKPRDVFLDDLDEFDLQFEIPQEERF